MNNNKSGNNNMNPLQNNKKENKAFIGFWRNNIMHGYVKLIVNENQKFGIWEGGQFKEKLKKN